MSRLASTILLLVVLAAGLLPSATSQDNPIKYRLVIDCPQRALVSTSVGACPIFVEDGQDAMGNPSVAVDPKNPNYLIMASLHGGDGRGPTELSRNGQVFTTFTSTDHGGSWTDNPFTGPPEVDGAFGEHPQIVVDHYGRAYVGSLYAQNTGAGQFDWILSAQKFRNLQQINAEQSITRSNGAYNAQLLDPIHKGNQITQYWYVFDPLTDNMTILWHERPYKTQAPTTSTSVAKGLLPGARLDGDAPTDEAEIPTSLITTVFTTSSLKSRYVYALDENLIGPCSTSTNPVLSEGYIYVGCVVDPKAGVFRWDPAAKEGAVHLFRFTPDDAPVQYLGASPITGGTPRLGVRSDGRIALFSSDVNSDGAVRLVGAYGHFRQGKIDWSPVYEYANKFQTPDVNRKVVEVRIQDLEYREFTGAVHIILKQRVQYVAATSGVPPSVAVLQPTIRKSLVAIDERYGYLASIDLDIGNPTNRSRDPALQANADSLYNDLSDDLVRLPTGPYKYKDIDFGDRYQREFYAVADYGRVQFAEIIEITDLRAPGAAPAPGGPPPIPAASASINVTTVFLSAAGLSAAGLFSFALLANRRKNPLASYTKGEK